MRNTDLGGSTWWIGEFIGRIYILYLASTSISGCISKFLKKHIVCYKLMEKKKKHIKEEKTSRTMNRLLISKKEESTTLKI